MRVSHLIGIILLALFCAPIPCFAKKLIQPTPRAVEHNNRGAALLSKGQLAEAEFELKTAIQLSPDYAEAYNNLGIIYKQQKHYDLAVQHFEKAFALNKEYTAPLSHIGAVHIARGQLDQAITILRKAVNKEPTFADAIYNLGLAYLLKARETGAGDKKNEFYKDAEQKLQLATQLNTQLVEAHLNLGDLYMDLQRYEEAEIRYRLALEDNPQRTEAYEHLAKVLRIRGKAGEAQQLTQRGAEISKANAAQEAFDRGYRTMQEGETLAAEGKADLAKVAFQRSATAFREALKLRSDYPEASYGLGIASERVGDHAAARQAWEQVLKLQPQHPGALFNLGTLALKQGRESEGCSYFCDFLRIAGNAYPEQRRTITDELRKRQFQCPR